MKKKTWYIIAPVLAAVLVFLDQITKYLARRDLAESGYSIIEDVFRLELVTNKGAAWGMLQGKVDILSIISIILVALVVICFFKIPEGKKYHIMRVLCVMVCAGAIGNLIDRFVFGGVTDFLYFELINFPVFNVADCYITIAMVLFLILMIFYYKDDDLSFISFKKKDGSVSDNKNIKNDEAVSDDTDDEKKEAFSEDTDVEKKETVTLDNDGEKETGSLDNDE